MDYHRQTDVGSVTVTRTSDGELQQTKYSVPIEVRAYHFSLPEDDPEAAPAESWEARFQYRVDDGVAKLFRVKDPDGEYSKSNWFDFGFLRLLAGVEEAVAEVDGVERVEKAEETLGRELEKGREADTDPE